MAIKPLRNAVANDGDAACGQHRLFELLELSSVDRLDIHTATFAVEVDGAVAQSVQRPVVTNTNVGAWVPLGSVLTSQNVASDNRFAAELLDSKSFCY